MIGLTRLSGLFLEKKKEKVWVGVGVGVEAM